MKPLAGRSAVITGGNQGLGLAIAKSYVEAGADVLLCARDVDKLKSAKQQLGAFASSGQKIEIWAADVSSSKDVARLAEQAVSFFSRIDILVNNAGIHGPKGLLEEISWEEWVRAIEINLFGSVLMCRALLPHFKKNRHGKIIQLSGGGATKPMPCLSAYAVSKAGIVRFVETLAEEVREFGIDVNAVAPGAVNTRLLDDILEAGPAKVGESYFELSLKQKSDGGTPPEKGAALCVFLASKASDGITGKLISAVWDPWEELPKHLDDMKKTDIYTLRRIVPKDRSRAWGEK